MYRVFQPETFENRMYFDATMMFCLNVVKNRLVSNPHTRALMTNFICEFGPSPPNNEFKKQEMSMRGLLPSSPICKKYLIPTLLLAYGDVEKTGSNNQYYERYQYRFNMSNVLQFLLKEKYFQEQLDEIAEKEIELFDRFTHFFISDINDTLQDGISKLKEIRSKLSRLPYRVRGCEVKMGHLF